MKSDDGSARLAGDTWTKRRLGVLGTALVGVVVGIIGWGGFNTAMEATNSLEFCVSCHEMRSTVYEEYKTSVHWSNPSGVRAVCSDCHVPKDWTHKLIRKVQASKELWAKLAGTIDTPEKFADRRLDLARHEWDRMRASDSRECRNCHSFAAMDFHKQRPKSAEAMRTAEEKGYTCIDCHKGIAHRLPDLVGRHRAMAKALSETPPSLATGATVTTLEAVPIFAEAVGGEAIGRFAPLTSAVVVGERRGDRVLVETTVWRREGAARTLYAEFGRRIAAMTVVDPDRLTFETVSTRIEPKRDDTWTEERVRVWAAATGWSTDEAGIAAYGAEMYEATCSFCHALPRPADHDAEKWIANMNAMRRMVPLEEGEIALLLKYLQSRARDASRPLG